MRPSPTLVGLIVVLLATSGGAVIHGRLVNRWGPPQALLDAANQLQAVPERIGAWEMKSSQSLPESARLMLECAGDFARTYVNSTTREVATVTMIVGPVGPTGAHSPEVCLPAHDYRLVEDRERVHVRDAQGVKHELWSVGFQSQDLQASRFHVLYAWSTGDAWIASDQPRFDFSGSPYLYKVQFVVRDGSGLSHEELPSFVADFLPAVRASLLPVGSATLPGSR